MKGNEDPGSGEERALIARVGNLTCAIPLGHVVETMRPMPVEGVRDAPPFVRGLAIIRGKPTVVIDMALLLGIASAEATARFVVARVGERTVALTFDEVVDVRAVSRAALAEVPPLLRHASPDVIAAIGASDSTILLLLESALVLSPEALQRIGTRP